MKLASLICGLALFCMVSAELFTWADDLNATPDYNSLFVEFVEHFDRVYESESEFFARRKIFQQNLERAREWQALNPLAKMGVTQFSDLTLDEFSSNYLTLPSGNIPPGLNAVRLESSRKLSPDTNDLPQSFSWANQGKAVAVQNQGQCGSCYCFSAMENLGAVTAIKKSTSPIMPSVSQSLDCNSNCDACNGCWPHRVWDWLATQQTQGVCSAYDYPYTPVQSSCRTCDNPQFTASKYGFTSGDPNTAGQESDMPGVLYSYAPLSIAVDASYWNSYAGGIVQNCGGTTLDHAVLLIGYAPVSSKPGYYYWIVRNSWGASWGESGNIYLLMGSNVCGITQYGGGGTVTQL